MKAGPSSTATAARFAPPVPRRMPCQTTNPSASVGSSVAQAPALIPSRASHCERFGASTASICFVRRNDKRSTPRNPGLLVFHIANGRLNSAAMPPISMKMSRALHLVLDRCISAPRYGQHFPAAKPCQRIDRMNGAELPLAQVRRENIPRDSPRGSLRRHSRPTTSTEACSQFRYRCVCQDEAPTRRTARRSPIPSSSGSCTDNPIHMPNPPAMPATMNHARARRWLTRSNSPPGLAVCALNPKMSGRTHQGVSARIGAKSSGSSRNEPRR